MAEKMCGVKGGQKILVDVASTIFGWFDGDKKLWKSR